MRMSWLKLMHSARTDPKLESLTDQQHRVWFRLLIFASEQRTRGLIRYSSERILAVEVSRGDVDLLRETVSVLGDLGLVQVISGGVTSALHGALHGGSILLPNFEDVTLQGNKSVTRDRVRKYREKKRLGDTKSEDVTPLKRDVTHVTRVTHREDNKIQDTREEIPPIVGIMNSRPREDCPDHPDDGPILSEKSSVIPMAPRDDRIESAIAAARVEFGDEIANRMDLLSTDIDSSLGGRWDCYLAAVRKVKRMTRPISDLHSYALRVAQQYAATGIPPEPIAHVPSGSNGHVPDAAWRAKHEADLEVFERNLMADLASRNGKNGRRACI